LVGGATSRGYGINASGQVTGWATAAGATNAFLYSNGVMQNLGPWVAPPAVATASTPAGR
jgi:probable HAF family extracellular repeat protein